MFKIRRTELMECPDDEEYVLVMTSSLIHVTLPSHSEKDEESASALSSGDAAAAAAADEGGGTRAAETLSHENNGSLPLHNTSFTQNPEAITQAKIRSRPQPGNRQYYFSMFHKWAGRSAGAFGRPAWYK